MVINYLLIVFSAFLLNFLFLLILKKIAFKYNFFISKGTPHIGGIAVGLSFVLIGLLSLSIDGSRTKETLGILIASVTMLIFGIIDDHRELSVFWKFFVQIISISLLIILGVKTQIVNIGNAANIIITTIWVLGITNAFNHLDIMDGLAGGVAYIASLAFLILSILNGHNSLIVLALAITGSIFSFMLYNFPPAKIYMGNSGSHLLGFVLASIALAISYASTERKIALLSPILILGLPIFDTAFLILMRLMKRKSIFKKSEDHLAMRFFKKGYSKNKTLIVILSLASMYSLFGILIALVPNFLGLVIVIFMGIMSFLVAKNMSRVSING